ncbi:MAG: phosphoenolpyruvate carboxylase [Comamonadaceae bacterium]|nr:phosphoenolpyruvate carboxylase [Comamonadaceae bacterium]
MGLLNIGSRPSHRKKADRSHGLDPRDSLGVRLGAVAPHPAGLVRHRQRARQASSAASRTAWRSLQAMYREWPFFRGLLSNVQMALTKADMEIAEEYARLCDHPNTMAVYRTIADEFALHRGRRQAGRADHGPAGRESVAGAVDFAPRVPTSTRINHIQVRMLKRYRTGSVWEAEQDTWLTPLKRSINAIAAGMRNTG